MYTLTVLQQIIQLVHIGRSKRNNKTKAVRRKGVSSLISLDLTGRAPIYEQICQRISELIATGVLKENDKLPGARTMAKDLGLNPNTVAKAYSRLDLNGIIYSVAGKGCFVAKQQGSIQKKLLDEFDEKAQAALNAGVSAEQLCERIEKIENIAQQKENKENKEEKKDIIEKVEKGEGNIDSDQ